VNLNGWHVAIRVDASIQIGTGHFMRCLTLAEALKQYGAQVCFVSYELQEYLCDLLNEKSIGLISLLHEERHGLIMNDLTHSHWLDTSQLDDATESIQALSDRAWDLLVVDHYSLDVIWETQLRKVAKRIMVVDDIADRQHNCDILLDQNYFSTMAFRYKDKVPKGCALLLGPDYALVRKEFRSLHKQVKIRTEPLKRILVFFGGIDALNYTECTIEVLTTIPIEGLHVDVVIGEQHPCREQIELACADNKFHCYVQTEEIAELMALADLSIGAGGSATWERCCLGLPSLIVSLADNQNEIAKAVDSLGAALYLGSHKIANAAYIQKAIIELANNKEHLRALSETAYSIVDGLGSDRLCEVLAL
tara:strand:- start:1500 stop:2591 length:1092 start_codon:yes stop_codon:yes gene_type:complete